MVLTIHKKALILGLLILVSSVGYLSNVSGDEPVLDRQILYVGGTGGGNYSSIQDAIDNASNGDTVFVYNGTYFENVVIDKTINLIGLGRNNTIINGDGFWDVITLNQDMINISHFTITTNNSNESYSGFLLESHNNLISKCSIINNSWVGIDLRDADNNIITDCIIHNNNLSGIGSFTTGSNNEFVHNIISNNIAGIVI